jgi:guanine deaminase
MELAKKNAEIGVSKNEGGPFGAVIVDENNNIIATGNNKVLLQNDPTAHAEIVSIRAACKKLNTYDLTGMTIYTSCEPCPMCLSAIIWSNISTVYFACTKNDAANIGFRDDAIYEYLKGSNKSLLNLTQIDRLECLELFKNYNKTIY